MATITNKRYCFCRSVINLKPSINSYLPLFLQVYLLCQCISAVFSTVLKRTALFLGNMYLVVSASQELLARHMLASVYLVAPKERSTKSKTFSCCRGHRTASEDVLEGTGGNFIGSLYIAINAFYYTTRQNTLQYQQVPV